MRLPVLWLDGAYVYVESQCFFSGFLYTPRLSIFDGNS
jgi:hypothetical protein